MNFFNIEVTKALTVFYSESPNYRTEGFKPMSSKNPDAKIKLRV